ncbi:ABC transporter ATP-binding protein [Streptococcus massiliensis]|uniref:ABC transporter ATP-binding protein n=1 Tax=Streptococcus massiliensis TaxID=313439 RepID=A0A380L327_9STRE|nr:ABC transporter ATP-binding protein [Streptococcus massiliensis]SUN76940.1 ABC transporter ATP-binding protein [Streptococcus massiliensis]
MKLLLHLQGLKKSFGNQVVLSNVSFDLQAATIVGLIGPSGAGKSTMIKTMLGMEKADSGEALVLGSHMPDRHILGDIGYMAQSDALYESLSARENLEFFGQMKGIKKRDLLSAMQHVAEVVDLTPDLEKKVRSFSGGMKRRLSLAIALLGKPELLILDEPTVGIDPALRRQIWTELTKLRDEGVGILVTTHVMDEAELTDKVGLLLQGQIIAFDTPTALKEQYQVPTIEDVFLKAEENIS